MLQSQKTKNKKQTGPFSLHSYLHTTGQHGMKDMRSLLHDSDIFGSGVSALAVLDGVDEAVSEFAQ